MITEGLWGGGGGGGGFGDESSLETSSLFSPLVLFFGRYGACQARAAESQTLFVAPIVALASLIASRVSTGRRKKSSRRDPQCVVFSFSKRWTTLKMTRNNGVSLLLFQGIIASTRRELSTIVPCSFLTSRCRPINALNLQCVPLATPNSAALSRVRVRIHRQPSPEAEADQPPATTL